MTHTPVPVFDGHNDTLLKLELGARKGSPRDFLARADHDHIDLPRAREGGFAGGFFAMFSPSLSQSIVSYTPSYCRIRCRKSRTHSSGFLPS